MNQFISNKNGGSSGSDLGYQDFERLNESPEIQRAIDEEFGSALRAAGPGIDAEGDDGFSRRHWLQLMGASLALGAAGCRYQPDQLVPYAFRPQNRIPGTPVQYASMIDFAGYAHPVEATSYDGRPIKLDGNRLHPQTKNLSERSPGPSAVFTQARILELYDPDRLRSPMVRKGSLLEEATHQDFVSEFRKLLNQKDLSSVAILAEPSASPSVQRIQKEFVARGGHLHFFTPVTDDNAREGSKQAFGQVVRPSYEFDKARVIVCLDADPLLMDGDAIRNNRLFAAGRDVDHSATMSRMYCVESDYSTTGACADHRMSLPSSRIASFLGALAAEIGKRKAGDKVDSKLKYREKLLAAMAQDLVDHNGAGVIVVGDRQPAAVHAAAHKLNEQLGNVGKIVSYTAPLDADRPLLMASLMELKTKIEAGTVKTLVIAGGNPVYDAPVDVDFKGLISKCSTSIHLSYYKNETSNVCNWVYNLAHPLEAWGDGLAYDGSWCLAQPLISPLFGGRSLIEMLSSAMGDADVTGLSIVEATAKEKLGAAGFESKWRQAVHDGFVADSAAKPLTVTTQSVAMPENDGAWGKEWDSSAKSLELVFTTSRAVHDGRFANNAWLQELPDFVTKITWDNAALVNPETAKKLGLKQDTLYRFSYNGREIGLPVHIQPGQAKGSIAVSIGYGRKAAGAVGGDVNRKIEVGFDVAPLRDSTNWFINNGVEVFPSSGTVYKLAVIQPNWEIDATGRNEIQNRMFMNEKGERSALLREGSFESYRHFLEHNSHDSHQPGQAKSTALPILHNVAFEKKDETKSEKDKDHGHGHSWPTAFHEHELFDLTPGVRETYRADNPNMKNAWGMSIDLNKCTGCNACVVACQAENNIPIVGKWQVFRGREMHWMRLDTYFGNNLFNTEAAQSDDKQLIHQPMACHHCENAPCETVCPVAATVHSTEGLNDMVYNRCIGTRYCGNNCPYKVRRFNYLNYSDAVTFVKYPEKYADRLTVGDRSLQNLVMNPEVTIRSRGVMEKCTYCVQRIQNTKIVAKTEGNRPLGANEITTACQDVCPAGAIKFGDLAHLESDVRREQKNPRAYALLSELNNIPRTKYLARVRNPHPALMDQDDRGPQSDTSDELLAPNIEM
jgi:Fe-S-cluster-containing dehydrogenase component